MFAEEVPPITPVNFFQMSLECRALPSGEFPRITAKNRKKYALPVTAHLCDEYPFAELSMGWSADGIEIFAHVKKQFEDARYPDVQNGDSVELLIDTRDVKSIGFNNRFCHHFVFLPKAVGGVQAHEITRFRTEDTHEICDPHQLETLTQFYSNHYTLQMYIPSECLFGYEPEQFQRIGFTYRINRPEEEAQHFSVCSDEYRIDQQPALWSSVRLVL